jgi:hypothetical protein
MPGSARANDGGSRITPENYRKIRVTQSSTVSFS